MNQFDQSLSRLSEAKAGPRGEGGGVWYFGFIGKAEKEKDLFASLAEDKLVSFVAQDRRNFMV